MSKSKLLCLVFAVVIHCPLFTVHCFSAGPNFIAKQGQIRVSGQPVTGAHKMHFRMYTSPGAPISGTAWEQVIDNPPGVYFINGMFNYPLTNGIDGLDFSANTYYMSMAIDNGNEMLPREPLAALPYAFAASTATCLRGNGHIRITGGGDHYIANGNVGIGKTNPLGTFHVLAGGTTFFISSTNGSVGVGTTNPSKLLDVNGDIVSSGGRIYDKTGYAGVPGEIKMFGGSAAPVGWLLCNGAAVSRTTYAELFAAIGTTFGVGDGSLTFNLPDFRNVFPRGANSSARTISSISYPALALGGIQTDKFQGHKHSIGAGGTHNHQFYSYYPPSMIGNMSTFGYHMDNSAGAIAYWGMTVGWYSAAEFGYLSIANNTHTHPASEFDAALSTDGTNGTPRTGTITEPQSLGVNYIIKY